MPRRRLPTLRLRRRTTGPAAPGPRRSLAIARHARLELHDATRWITSAALAHGAGLAAHVEQRLGVSPRQARALLSRLAAAQWLTRGGTPRRPQWQPGPLRQVVVRYALDGLDEGRAWRRDFAPCLELPAPVARLAQHAFTELVNNAVDHSGGTQVTVSVRQTPLQVQLLVSDDGCGLFDRIAGAHVIDEPRLAMAELAKGRLTTQPDRHRGHGLFFVARTADVLDLRANGAAFQHRGWDPARWHDGRPLDAAGTSVYAAFAIDTPRTLEDALREHAADPGRPDLDRTTVPMALLADAGGVLESRALARRAAARLDRFRDATLDFAGVRSVGHGFADELFRVQARRGDGLRLRVSAAAPEVAAVIAAASVAT